MRSMHSYKRRRHDATTSSFQISLHMYRLEELATSPGLAESVSVANRRACHLRGARGKPYAVLVQQPENSHFAQHDITPISAI